MQTLGAFWNLVEYYRYLQISWITSVGMIIAVIWTATCMIIGTTGSYDAQLYSINQIGTIMIGMALLLNLKLMQKG